MGVKKDIGKTYNDKLKDINIAPDDKVWEKIQNTLDNKKKNKTFPFWARAIGIGLLLLLIGGYGYNSFFNNSSNNSPTNNTEEKLNQDQNNKLNNDLLITDTNDDNHTLDKVDDEQNPSTINDSKKTELTEESTEKSKNNVSTIKNEKDNSKNNSELNNSVNSKKNSNKTKSQNFYKNKNSYSDSKKANNNSELNKKITKKNLTNYDSNIGNKKSSSTKNNSQITSNDIDNDKRNTKSIITNQDNIINLKNNEKPIDSINKLKNIASDSIIKKDTLLIAKQIDSTLINKKLEEPKSEWEVGAYIIPTYFGSLTKGSSLGEILTENKKQANITLSYRVLANFKLSNKLTLRTGFGSTKLSTTTLNATRTDANGMMANLGAFSNLSYDFIKLNEVETSNSLGSNTDINFKEELTYFELPIELVYKFEPKNNITWKVFSGISTYKISNNRVYAESANGSFEIAQANNLKQYSFSFNLGGGLDYKINDKINITAEPIVRYHINMYKRKVFNYNPINTGLSIGLSYKF